jgi:hypothetical protein
MPSMKGDPPVAQNPKRVVKKFIEFADLPLPTYTATPFPAIVDAVFLCRALVYIPADRSQTQILKNLTLCKMHLVLKALTISDGWYIEDIVSLIEYCRPQGGEEPLRKHFSTLCSL